MSALASLAEIYVNDAFGSAHRAHASTEGITHYLKPAVAGLLMEKEITYLGKALESIRSRSITELHPVILNHRIRQYFMRNRLEVLARLFRLDAFSQSDVEELALADVLNLAKSQRRKGMLNSLALRIEYRALGHHPHVSFHARHYSKPSAATPE